MNCMDFRRVSLEDPQGLPDSAAQHMVQCASCDGYYRQLLQQERLLERALNVEVPEDLVAQTMLRHGFEQRGGTPKALESTQKPQAITREKVVHWRKWLAGAAVAASVVLVSFGINLQQPDSMAVAGMLASHVEEEAHTLQLTKPVSQGRLANTFNNVDIQQLAHLGDVTFAGNCLVDGKWAAHLVVQTEQGPVTVLLMPNSQLRDIDQIDGAGGRVQTVTLDGGTMALIGSANGELDQVRERVVSSVRILHI